MIAKTNLYHKHLALNAKMVDFAGYLMPIEYRGLKNEHLAVRERVGMFDVSHMGTLKVKGTDAVTFLEQVFTNNVGELPVGQTRYGFFCTEDGGVVDDLLIYRLATNDFMLVVNAAKKEKDLLWLKKHKESFDVTLIDQSGDLDILALQGPLSASILESILNVSFANLASGHLISLKYDDEDILVSRTGYTGEDGFEIYASAQVIINLWDKFLVADVEPCGLGCRDTLRFEAGMPLYGHELSATISPLEAGLGFAVKLTKEFIGKNALLAQKTTGLTKKVVGLELLERGIPREGYELFKEDTKVGVITTGYLSPSTGKPLAFALVDIPYTEIGSEVDVLIRGRRTKAVVRDKQFYRKRNKI